MCMGSRSHLNGTQHHAWWPMFSPLTQQAQSLPWVRFESYPGIRCFLTTEYIPSHSDDAERAKSQTSGDPTWWGKEAKVTVRNNVCFISSTPLNFRVGNNIESVGKYNTVNLNWIPFWSISMIISHMNLVSCTALKQCFNSFSCLETSFPSTTATKITS